MWDLPRPGIELVFPALAGRLDSLSLSHQGRLSWFFFFFFGAMWIKYQMIFQNHEWRSERCQVPLLWGSILKSTDKADSTVLDQGRHHRESFQGRPYLQLVSLPKHLPLSVPARRGRPLLVPSRNYLEGLPLGTAKVLRWSFCPSVELAP